jgi:N-methylhydantoinase B/acetone carboxylase, alpha subunit
VQPRGAAPRRRRADDDGRGGGFGDARERDPEAVRADVADRHVSAQAARERYGVDIEDGAR